MTGNTNIRAFMWRLVMVISHSVKNGLTSVLIALAASGCLFSAEAEDTDTDTDTDGTDTEAAETGAMTAATATTATTGTTDATDATETTDATDADTTSATPGTSTSDDTSTSTGSQTGCDPFAEWVWAVDVPTEDTTFMLSPSMSLPEIDGEPVEFLRSVMAGQGTAALSFETQCTDEVFLWALTWDADASVESADAYQVGLDQDTDEVAEDGVRWEYGCDNDAARWAWYRIRDTGFKCDPDGELEPTLDAGEHYLQINNPEPVNNNPQFNRTGFAALVVTNDPEYDPHSEYDPTPRD